MNSVIRFCLIVGIVLHVTTATAQNDNYTTLNGPYGGDITDIISSGSRLIGCVGYQGIVISDDGGATWTESNSGLTEFFITDLELDPVSGKIYALTGYRLFSSSDNGASWVVVATSGFAQGRFIKRSPTGNLFIASETGVVYRSTDGGTTWPGSASSTLPGSPSLLDFEISNTGYLFFATASNGVFRSNSPNSTIGFTQFGAAEGLSTTETFALTISGSDIYVVTDLGPFKSSNHGGSWSSVKSNISDTHFYHPRALIEQNGGSIFLLNTAARTFWKSDDGGTSWTTVSFPMDNYGNEYSDSRLLYVASPTTIFVSFEFGTFKSTDAGLNWIDVNSGITSHATYYPDVLMITDNGRLLYSPLNFGFYMSIDDGATWDFYYSSPLDRQITGFKKIGSTIYGYGGGLIKTDNNGDSWTEVFSESGQILGCYNNFSLFGIADANTFYTIKTYNCNSSSPGYFLSKSVDGGANWTALEITGLPPVGDSNISGETGLLIDAAGNAYVQVYNYSSGMSRAYKINLSTGAASDIMPSSFSLYSMDYYNGKVFLSGYTGTGYQLRISVDAGGSWTVKTSPNAYGRLNVINDNTFYLLGSNAFVTTDGGESWVDTGTFGHFRHARNVQISPSDFSYIAVNEAPVFKSNASVIPPSPPSDLATTGYGPFVVQLKWKDNSDNESQFIVERSIGSNTNYDSVAFVNSNNFDEVIFTLGGQQENTLYYYRVRAVGAAGKSAYSNEISITTVANCETYTIPANRSWTATTQDESGRGVFTDTEVEISGGNGSYAVYGLSAGSLLSGISPAINDADFAYSIQEICGTVFFWTTSPLYGNGNGTWDPGTNTLTIHWQTRSYYSPQVSETTVLTLNATDPAPSPPANLGAYVKTLNEIVVTWAGSKFAQQYQVQRSTSSGSGFEDIGDPVTTGSSLLVIDEDVFAEGVTYYYRVVATAFGGASSTSPEISIEFQKPLFEAISLPDYDFPTQGISWADIDNDGDDDLLVTPFNMINGHIGVLENKGDGTFEKISVTGITDQTISTLRAISVGDINNDGLVDLLINGSLTGGFVLMNKGQNEFERKSLTPGDLFGLAWYAELADINNDGRLDATVTKDVSISSSYMKIFTQDETGEFVPYELGEIAADASQSRAGSWADYDNDGDMDFLRARFSPAPNDFDQLYRNNGDGTFTPVTGTAFEADASLGSRSVSWGDFDNDLDLDVYVVHNGTAPNSMLYRNNGDGTFTRLTSSLLSEPKTVQSFGSAWGDIDNDGDLDMIVANSLKSTLYLNDGIGNFTKHGGAEYLVAYDISRNNIAFALADYDKNGTLDIATGKNQNNFPTILLKNNIVPGTATNWIQIKLSGTASNRSAIGARIVITTPDNKKQMRAISSLTGYGSAGSLTAHFGLYDQTSVSSIEVYWPSGTVQKITNKTANQIISITEDGTPPAHTILLPAASAQNVSTGTKLEIAFNEPTFATAGKTIKIVKADNPAVTVFSADVSTGVKTDETYSFTVSPKLELSTAYHVILDPGAFVDEWENQSAAIGGNDWPFSTGTGFTATSYNPSANAVNVLLSSNLEITFGSNVTAVPEKRIKVLNGSSVVLDISAASAMITGKVCVIDPDTDLPPFSLLEVIIDAGAFIDETQNDFAGIASGEWTFTTIDATKPEITVDPTPLALLEKNFSPKSFLASARDNVGVVAVTFFHRKIGQKDFTATPMTKVPETHFEWTVQVNNSFADDMGFQFYLEAMDGVDNITRSPGDDTQYYQSRVTFSGDNRPVVSVPGGGTDKSWKIISIPYDLGVANPQISQVFSDLGTASPTTWRMVTYENVPLQAWLEFPEGFATIQRGKGYFINAMESKNIQLADAVAPAFNQNNLFQLNLVQGWNQIGNPYTVTLNWENVRTFNEVGSTVGGLKLFANGAYVDGVDLLPLQGGFVLAQNATTISLPFPGQTPSGGRSNFEQPGADLGGDAWVVRLKLEMEDQVNDFGGIGMHPDASTSFDGFDDVNPPRFINHLEMNFDHPEHFAKRFARDVVPKQEDFTWPFTVSSNLSGIATLVWDNQHFGDNPYQLFLHDLNSETIIDMRATNSYAFDPKQSGAFKIYFGRDLTKNLTPNGTSLGKPYPNPSAGNITIPFSLSDHNSLYNVRLEIFDLVGRKVKTILDTTLTPGYYTPQWATDESQVTDGTYICRLVVSLNTSEKSVTTKTARIVIMN